MTTVLIIRLIVRTSVLIEWLTYVTTSHILIIRWANIWLATLQDIPSLRFNFRHAVRVVRLTSVDISLSVRLPIVCNVLLMRLTVMCNVLLMKLTVMCNVLTVRLTRMNDVFIVRPPNGDIVVIWLAGTSAIPIVCLVCGGIVLNPRRSSGRNVLIVLWAASRTIRHWAHSWLCIVGWSSTLLV